jgi:membrane protease YdiL (CAAX protease family)
MPAAELGPGCDGRVPAPLIAALLAAALLFAVNFAANHLWPLPGGRYGYALFVILLTGTVVPCVVLTALARRSAIDLRRWGYSLAPVELLKIALGLALGVAIGAFPVGAAVRAEPAHAVLLFVWLIGASLMEVLVFCGIVHNVVATIATRRLPRWAATLLAAAIASLAFGFYHFSHAPPWNTLSTALTLTVVWLAVSAIFVATRSLWAASAFNTVMATVGFIVNHVIRLDDQSIGAGLAFAAFSVLVVVVVPVLARPRR